MLQCDSSMSKSDAIWSFNLSTDLNNDLNILEEQLAKQEKGGKKSVKNSGLDITTYFQLYESVSHHMDLHRNIKANPTSNPHHFPIYPLTHRSSKAGTSVCLK